MKSAKSIRIKLFTYLGVILLIFVTLYYCYYHFIASNSVSTNNAYVGAEIAQITPEINGSILKINCKNTDLVKQNEILVILDDTDAKLALAEAKANLQKLQAMLEQTKQDYERRINLSKTGAISNEEISKTKNALTSAQASFDAGNVAVQKAKINLARTVIRSPISGIVAKRQAQFGQRVPIGFSLMSIIPAYNLHVDANFKEVQLRKVRLGQKVTMHADIYGKSITYEGEVVGIAGGTGSAFAIIPSQNATGNWIKVVQRLPVRISLDKEQLKKHPLKIGLSMNVSIDVSESE